MATLVFDAELVSLDLTGGPFPMPLASDPANQLGDSIDGFGWVDTEVSITLSSQRPSDAVPAGPGPASTGKTVAFLPSNGTGPGSDVNPEPVDPRTLDGETFFVDSFFDVFFDITVTDVDPRPGRDFAGQPDGASFLLSDNGPAPMQSHYEVVFDKEAPSFGLAPPPQMSPYVGHFLIEIPLGGDINGNGENDKIKFTIASHAVGDENRTVMQLPDGTVIDQFESAAFLEGAIVDESTDPPFTLGAGNPLAPAFTGPGALTGPATAASMLLNPLTQIVNVDVKPGNSHNNVNAKSQGVVQIAIYTTADFDAASVDVSTIRLAGVEAVHAAYEDIDGDGDLDLILHFPVQDLLAMLDIDFDSNAETSVQVQLSGETVDHVLLEGFDTINFFFPGKSSPGKGKGTK